MTKIITVKNADGELDTQAEVIVQNNIKYTPKVSVIVSVYNVEQYLKECLDSIVNQTLKEIEIICIDDGSTDSSLEILKEYAKHDNRITILKQQNLRAGIARNAGLSVAKGEYLSFLDSDDFFELNMHESMYNKAKENDVDIVMCNAYRYDDTSKQIKMKFGIYENNIPSSDLFNSDLLGKNWCNISIPTAWNKLYKRIFIIKNKIYFQNLSSCNDVGFDYSALSVANKITFLKDCFVYYRMFTKVQTSHNRGAKAINIFNAYYFIKNYLEKHNRSYLINFLNSAIHSNVRFEVLNCSPEQLEIFKAKSILLLENDWDIFKEDFDISTNINYLLLGFIPLLSIKIQYNTIQYKLFGITFLKINSKKKNKTNIKTIFNIPLVTKYVN